MDNTTKLHFDQLQAQVEGLQRALNTAINRIAELEHDLYAMPDPAQRRDMRQLKEKYKQQGLSGNQAKKAAWNELHRP
jgi:hypothetical protein